MNRISIGVFLFLIALAPLIGCSGSGALPPLTDTPSVQAGESLSNAQGKSGVRFSADYRQGMEAARQESKPMLLFFALQNCTNSQRMRETTFRDAEVKRLSERFVCLSIDGAVDAERCESYKVKNFPTILILNVQGTELQRLSGKQDPKELALQMNVAIQSTAAKSVPTVRK